MNRVCGPLTRFGDIGRPGERWSVRRLMTASGVRRGKPALSSGCKPHLARGCDHPQRRRRTEGRAITGMRRKVGPTPKVTAKIVVIAAQ